MTIDEMEKFVVRSIPQPALYEQCAEECTELAQACLKAARVMRGESPTPVTIERALAEVNEEATDVINLLDCLFYSSGIGYDKRTAELKMERWVKRIEARQT